MCINPVPFGEMQSTILKKCTSIDTYCYLKKLKLPCGFCLGCRLDKLALWSARCNYELYNKGRSAFVTFTYNDYFLPFHDGSLCPTLKKDDLHKFIDNLRHKVKNLNSLPVGCCRDFSFFACGEYGDRFQRPHYHVLFFGLDFKDCEFLFKSCWKKGLIKSLPVTSGGVRYVVDYFTKNMVNGSTAESKYDLKGLERPFKSVSKGLGSELFFAHREEIRNGLDLKLGSRVVPVPVYYKNLLCNFSDAEFFSKLNINRSHYDKIVSDALKFGFTDVDKYISFVQYSNEQTFKKRLLDRGVPIGHDVSLLSNRKSNYNTILKDIDY